MVRGIYAIAGAMVLCTALGIVGWLSIHGIDTKQFLYFFASSVGPTIGILWNNLKTGRIKDKVDSIEENTNGVLKKKMKDAVKEVLDEREQK